VSHPTLLHHFGSREGLVQALYQRSATSLKTALVGVLQSPDVSSKAVIDLVFTAYRNGLAQRLVWMLQTEGALDPPPGGMPILEMMVQELTALRQKLRPDLPAPESDTRALIHLTTIAAFGDALIGKRIRGALTKEAEEEAREQFERWLGGLMDRHVVGGAVQ
jgi:AcrR family transcriptional regulator